MMTPSAAAVTCRGGKMTEPRLHFDSESYSPHLTRDKRPGSLRGMRGRARQPEEELSVPVDRQNRVTGDRRLWQHRNGGASCDLVRRRGVASTSSQKWRVPSSSQKIVATDVLENSSHLVLRATSNEGVRRIQATTYLHTPRRPQFMHDKSSYCRAFRGTSRISRPLP